MTRRKLLGFALLAAALGLALSMPGAAPAQGKDAPLKIGMVKAFFSDLPKELIEIVAAPFPVMMKQVTGLDGKLSYDDDAFTTAALLDANKLQFGVFHGHEFAWLQKKHPSLKPLLVVTNKEHNVQAFVIVHKDSPAKTIADLRGKTIDFPSQTKEHVRVFVGKYSTDNALNKAFFREILKGDTTNQALNALCAGKVDAVAVDSITLAFYKSISGPRFSKNLRVLQESIAYPPAVIVCKHGALKESTVKQFQDGLLKANKNPVGADMMKMWSIDGFDLPPANFQQMLDASLKEHPLPVR